MVVFNKGKKRKKITKEIVSIITTIGSLLFLHQLFNEWLSSIFYELSIALQGIIFVIAILYIIYSIYDLIIELKKNKATLVESELHEFDVPSEKHATFFKNWYSQNGKLTVYIESLEGWAHKPTPVYSALLEKSKDRKLKLYIEDVDADAVELKNNGAELVKIEKNELLPFSFSILKTNESAFVILKERNGDAGKNIIHELKPSLTTKLMEKMIDFIDRDCELIYE